MKHKQYLIHRTPQSSHLDVLQDTANRLTRSTPGLNIRIVPMENDRYVIVTDGSLSKPLNPETARYAISALVVGWQLHETAIGGGSDNGYGPSHNSV